MNGHGEKQLKPRERNGGDDSPFRSRPPSLRERIMAVLPTLLIDLILPYGMFFGLSQLGVSAVAALAAGGVLPALRTLYFVVRGRKVDGLALFVAVLFLLGIGMSLITGDPRFALAKESIFTGLIGVVCFGSLALGRPLMFYVRREMSPQTAEQWETIWQSCAAVRRNLHLSTLAWGVGLVVKAIVAIVVVYSLPTTEAAAVVLALNVGVVVVLTAVTHLLGFRLRKQTNEILAGKQWQS